MAHWGGSQQTTWPRARCSIRTSAIAVRFHQCTQAAGRLRRKHERRACLLCGPWLRNSQWLAVSYTHSLSIFCVLSLSIWEAQGASASLSVPRRSTLYLGLTLSPSPHLPQSEHAIGTRPWGGRGGEVHLYWNNALMPTRPPQSEGVGHSPQCTPFYNSLNQVTEHLQGK